MSLVFGLPVTVAFLAGGPSCSSSKSALAGLAQGCSINSDCSSPLVCVFSLCHDACAESRDCPMGERCVSAGANNVCQLPSEATCSVTSPCPTGLVCAADLQCRDACTSAQPCVSGDSCVDGVCYAPVASADGGSSHDGSGASDGTLADSSTDAPAEAPFVPNPDAGVLGFTPSNFDPLGVDAGDAGSDWSKAPAAEVTTTCTNCLPATASTIAMNDGTLADVYVLDSLLVDQTAALRLSGPNPIILAVVGKVDIQGQLLVNGTLFGPGPGGFATGANPGPGAGEGAYGVANPTSNGGGASYCGLGGHGGMTAPPAGAPGTPYGSATLSPLVGGSASGSGSVTSNGGGAIQIVAGQSITIRAFGAINAGGSGTTNVNNTGGGPSGGAILLEAPSVVIDGNVAANGGGGMSGFSGGADATANAQPAAGAAPYGGAGSAGTNVNGADGTSGAGVGVAQTGGGGGGAGRIRINTAGGSATISGIVSPALTTPCATQGTLN